MKFTKIQKVKFYHLEKIDQIALKEIKKFQIHRVHKTKNKIKNFKLSKILLKNTDQ